MVQTIGKPNKLAVILSTIGKPNTIGKPTRPLPFEFQTCSVYKFLHFVFSKITLTLLQLQKYLSPLDVS